MRRRPSRTSPRPTRSSGDMDSRGETSAMIEQAASGALWWRFWERHRVPFNAILIVAMLMAHTASYGRPSGLGASPHEVLVVVTVFNGVYSMVYVLELVLMAANLRGPRWIRVSLWTGVTLLCGLMAAAIFRPRF